ncbi:KIFC1 [Lepeophtheirus salmonis]|uniref:KIFC1 n=2 Tax=Lepeophtheirus salmonis TaxID=72036 RepID=A0A7R8CJ04_LEPSM|nr:KIFC1 [Lepeophtheirus salmonis]CAF2836277.1 KIFC1 [Lepeophtheirus salmonis]
MIHSSLFYALFNYYQTPSNSMDSKASGIARPVSSRLPTPRISKNDATNKRNIMGPTTTDLEQGTAKRARAAAMDTPKLPSNLNKAKSKSMMIMKGPSRRGVGGTNSTLSAARSFNHTAKMDSFARPVAPPSLRSTDKPQLGKGKGPAGPPKWDLKSRLEIMEKKSSNNANRIEHLEHLNTALKSNVVEKENMVNQNVEELSQMKEHQHQLMQQLSQAQSRASNMEEQKNMEIKSLKSQLNDLEFKIDAQKRSIQSLGDELDSKREELRGLKSTVATLTSTSAGMDAKLKHFELENEKSTAEISRLSKLSSDQEEQIRIYEEKARAFESERRKLHNLIQELKGNIRVFCRLRPLLGEEVLHQNGKINHISIKEDSKSLELLKSSDSSLDTGLKVKNTNYDFEFDKVFGPDTTQDVVFEEISQLVQSAIDGYNVCVFAYGQTGSGKTFTMEGGESSGCEGMIPKTIKKIFEETKQLVGKGWTYKLEASFLEIYNEEIHDLLATEKNLKYEIKMSDSNKKGEIYVSNAKKEVVTSQGQINNLLKLSMKNRAVAATNCNERSSRSHSVFILKITGSNTITSEACQGCLNLVDLAGSERLKDSGSEGARLKETQSINKSLANLSNVIMALAQKESHVPFRNSKLTHLLQNSLGGNSKTLMFVNISPREEFFHETLSSLRFATKVNQCQIGTATKRVR